MVAATAIPTLLEDWQARRARLAGVPAPAGSHAEVQIQVLDYLIERYRESPEAARPARCPLETTLHVNDRAIVVHHHLWQGKVGGAKSGRQARDRVASILQRMHDPDRDDAGFDPRDWLPGAEEPEEPGADARLEPSPLTEGFWSQAARSIRRGRDALPAIHRSLQTSTVLPGRLIDYLQERIIEAGAGDTAPAELLACCDRPAALTAAVLGWKGRLALGRRDAVTRWLGDFFCREENRGRVVESIRAALAAPEGAVRFEAARLLGRVGTLDDLGLLSDLLNLPPGPDEHPGEREALASAMRRISGWGQSLLEAAPTLLDDWHQRRERLADSPAPAHVHSASQIRVFNHVIARYRGRSASLRPARCPGKTTRTVRDRTVLVDNYLELASQGPGTTESPDETDEAAAEKTKLLWKYAQRAIRRGRHHQALLATHWALTFSRDLPEGLIDYLRRRCIEAPRNATKPARLLAHSTSPGAPQAVLAAWRDRLSARVRDAVTDLLGEVLCREGARAPVRDGIRAALADPQPAVRAEAAKLLARVGTLDDLGLLSDLLNLPPSEDEFPGERAALLHAMQGIARRTP